MVRQSLVAGAVPARSSGRMGSDEPEWAGLDPAPNIGGRGPVSLVFASYNASISLHSRVVDDRVARADSPGEPRLPRIPCRASISSMTRLTAASYRALPAVVSSFRPEVAGARRVAKATKSPSPMTRTNPLSHAARRWSCLNRSCPAGPVSNAG